VVDKPVVFRIRTYDEDVGTAAIDMVHSVLCITSSTKIAESFQ